MQYKVSELEGDLLSAAAAKCQGLPAYPGRTSRYADEFNAEDWRDAGPIIERERISLHMFRSAPAAFAWHSEIEDQAGRRLVEQYGPAPLIAAMRAYVASKYGDVVELP